MNLFPLRTSQGQWISFATLVCNLLPDLLQIVQAFRTIASLQVDSLEFPQELDALRERSHCSKNASCTITSDPDDRSDDQ